VTELPRTIPVDGTLSAVALDPHGRVLYIANRSDNSVLVIDAASSAVEATIPVGENPSAIALDPHGQKLYVTNRSSGNVSVIDTASKAVEATITVSQAPSDVAVSPDDGHHVYVVHDSFPGPLSVIDAATNTVIKTLNAGAGFHLEHVAVTPDGRHAYVTSIAGGVRIIDTATVSVSGSINVGGTLSDVAVSPDGRQVYVANTLSNNLSVIDTATDKVVGTIPTGPKGANPVGVAVAPSGTRVYVANAGSTLESGAVSLVDAGEDPPAMLRLITVGAGASKVAISPDGHHAYVSDGSSTSVSVVDTADSSVTTLDIGSPSLGVAVNPDGRHAYVSGGSQDHPGTVSVIDTATHAVSVIPLSLDITTSGNHGNGLAVSRDGDRVYVSGGVPLSVLGAVSVVDTASNAVIEDIDADTAFTGDVAVSADGGKFYVSDGASNSISVVNTITTAVTTQIFLGSSSPTGMAMSPDGSRLYVTGTNAASPGMVSVIDTATDQLSATIATEVGDTPAAVAVTQHHAYVTNTGSTTMSVIDTSSNNVTTVPVGLDPFGVAVSPDETRVYLSGTSFTSVPGSVSIIDTGRVMRASTQ